MAPQGAPVKVFADVRGILRLSAGDGPRVAGAANQADLGTAFALATSHFGDSLLQLSGNFGYGSQNGVPAAVFRTSYSRELAGGKPVISVTMRQLYLPERMGSVLAGSDAGIPILLLFSSPSPMRMRVFPASKGRCTIKARCSDCSVEGSSTGKVGELVEGPWRELVEAA